MCHTALQLYCSKKINVKQLYCLRNSKSVSHSFIAKVKTCSIVQTIKKPNRAQSQITQTPGWIQTEPHFTHNQPAGSPRTCYSQWGQSPSCSLKYFNKLTIIIIKVMSQVDSASSVPSGGVLQERVEKPKGLEVRLVTSRQGSQGQAGRERAAHWEVHLLELKGCELAPWTRIYSDNQ